MADGKCTFELTDFWTEAHVFCWPLCYWILQLAWGAFVGMTFMFATGYCSLLKGGGDAHPVHLSVSVTVVRTKTPCKVIFNGKYIENTSASVRSRFCGITQIEDIDATCLKSNYTRGKQSTGMLEPSELRRSPSHLLSEHSLKRHSLHGNDGHIAALLGQWWCNFHANKGTANNLFNIGRDRWDFQGKNDSIDLWIDLSSCVLKNLYHKDHKVNATS